MPNSLEDRIRWAAFEELRYGRPADSASLAASVRVTRAEVLAELRRLAGSGRIELDDTLSVIGSQGLTLTSTVHRLVLAGVQLHTWCALDAIGIPAALRVDAEVDTVCGYCAQRLHVHVIDGEPHADSDLWVWLPAGPCDNLRADFCVHANLFCNPNHLQQWRAGAGEPTGEVLDITASADLGRSWWAPPTKQARDTSPLSSS